MQKARQMKMQMEMQMEMEPEPMIGVGGLGWAQGQGVGMGVGVGEHTGVRGTGLGVWDFETLGLLGSRQRHPSTRPGSTRHFRLPGPGSVPGPRAAACTGQGTCLVCLGTK